MSDEINDPPTPDIPATEAGPLDPPDAGTPAEAIKRERDDLYDRLLRKTAEFDNFRKRVDRDRKEMIEWAAADVLNDVLAIADDFDRALAADAPPEAQQYKAGLELIQRQLADLLKKRGVTVIEAQGADFDPHVHQAVAYEEVPGARDGEVVDVLARGYKLGERLLRPAIVKVAKAS
ncbi:MAG: cofactor [Acidobacteriota bacterium]|jgi:molecular chaperone GrpE